MSSNGSINISWKWVAGILAGVVIILLQAINNLQTLHTTSQIETLRRDLARVEENLNRDLDELDDLPPAVAVLETRVKANELRSRSNRSTIDVLLDQLGVTE